MPNNNPTGKGGFKKGKSGNPKGRQPYPPEVLEAKKLTQVEFIRIVNNMLYMTGQELQVFIANPSITVIEMVVAQILKKAVIHGDTTRLQFLMDRIGLLLPKQIDVAHMVSKMDYTPLVELTEEDLDAKTIEIKNRLASIHDDEA